MADILTKWRDKIEQWRLFAALLAFGIIAGDAGRRALTGALEDTLAKARAEAA